MIPSEIKGFFKKINWIKAADLIFLWWGKLPNKECWKQEHFWVLLHTEQNEKWAYKCLCLFSFPSLPPKVAWLPKDLATTYN